MRAFIALEIPDFIRTSIAQTLLGADARYGIKPIPPQNMHIALDSKQGMSFTVLVNNINYRPGELVSKLTMDQFRRSLMEAPSQK